ncbi:CDK5 regulatory subunit-associated protein 3-like isoform X1 [Patiria miniata]|uniref:CDK5 regulatory subunit-associated protein 3 n=1 Tax=Patiria miniata TaxID=46514 RepID=A0A914A2T5_PATMI|nr:CDK5 regulatory subunit-associated protein 3-like isoform X1 [Patiria miniata]
MQKTDELTAQQIENLPIDISASKLLDWLIDRRHVNLKWQTAALAIREKINLAIQDMPEVDEIKQLLAGTYINYFHCVRIVELLKVSESGSKNIFGYYSSQRMKDWQEVVRLYEKDNLYLAEVAQMLIRNINYEIPSLKKQVAKFKQTQADCRRKEKDYQDNAAAAKAEYNVECRKLGIKGDKIKSELLEKVKSLPKTFGVIAEKTQSLAPVIEFYQTFVQFTVGRTSDRSSQSEIEVVPILQFIHQYGNATVYQWRTGKVPESVEAVTLSFLQEEEEQKADEIDWGDIDDAGDDSIDFGISLEEVGSEVLNFDIQVTVETSDGDVGHDGQGSSAEDDRIARGTDSLTLLDHPPTRNNFTNELLELEAFLMQRLSEMKGEMDVLSANQFQSAPSILQMKTKEDVSAMLDKVREILSLLTDSTIQHLMLIKSSPKYVDRLTESLKQKCGQEEKMLASKEAVHGKYLEAIEEERQLMPKIDKLVANTRILQRQIEQDISSRYKNRPVNLMGSINSI